MVGRVTDANLRADVEALAPATREVLMLSRHHGAKCLLPICLTRSNPLQGRGSHQRGVLCARFRTVVDLDCDGAMDTLLSGTVYC
jgi:hypothetical protein